MEAVRSNKADLRKLERFGFLVSLCAYADLAVAVLSSGSGDGNTLMNL
jgi:hypothetical protein